jgi:hypothetical protein
MHGTRSASPIPRQFATASRRERESTYDSFLKVGAGHSCDPERVMKIAGHCRACCGRRVFLRRLQMAAMDGRAPPRPPITATLARISAVTMKIGSRPITMSRFFALAPSIPESPQPHQPVSRPRHVNTADGSHRARTVWPLRPNNPGSRRLGPSSAGRRARGHRRI